MAVLEYVKVVIPELILYEERHHRTYGAQKTARIGDGVEGQIGHYICSGIVLSHLVARRREEREQYLVLRMSAAQILDEGPSLLELAQRGGMEPHILCLGINLLAQFPDGSALSLPHLAHLLAEQRAHGHTEQI